MIRTRCLVSSSALALAGLLAGCATAGSVASPPPQGETPLASATAMPSAASPSRTLRQTPFHPGLYPTRGPDYTLPAQRKWDDVLRFTPFAYSTPLPPSEQGPIDGLYALFDASEPQWWRCARCADFRPSGGNWLLHFDSGVMRLFYDVSGFATASSFTVDGDRLFLFNDPHCPYDVGEYTWAVDGGALVLSEVADECAIHLRAVNLTRQPWLSCAPAEGSPPQACEAAQGRPQNP